MAALAPHGAWASQETAKRYFQNGVELITAAQPNFQDAYYQFQLAYRESGQSWKVLGNLGLCALKLERDQEAAGYYEQYLKKGGSEIAAEERNAIEQDLLLLKGNLATVRLSSPVADLKIVDRRAGSSAPAQSYSLKDGALDLELRAGNHTLTATSGDRRLTWDVVLEPKTVTQHTFDFDAKEPEPAAPAAAPATGAPAAAVAPPKAPADTVSGGVNLRVPAYISLAVGAVGVGLGGYFMWQSSDYQKQSDDAFKCNSRLLGCTDTEKAKVRGLEDDSSSAKTRAIVAFGVGGAGIVTGVVLLAVSGSSSKVEQARAVVPWFGLREAGLSGRF
ncbi:MAG: hypothetical protein ABUL60_34140 [Myxococcales bacterium]